MSVSINSSGYSNAVNAYSSNQKAKPTLDRLQEIVRNSNTDTFTYTPLELIPDSNVTDGIPVSDRPAPETQTVTFVNRANNDVVIKWDIIEGASLRNVHDDVGLYRNDYTRDIYYSELFNNGIEYADTVLGECGLRLCSQFKIVGRNARTGRRGQAHREHILHKGKSRRAGHR